MKKIFRYVILVCMFLMLVACGKKDSEKACREIGRASCRERV